MSTNDNLITDNMNLAYDLAWKFYNKFQRKIDIEELQSICLLGLTKAGKTYNSELNINFSTYAYKCIINELLLYYKQNKKHLLNISLYTDIGDDIQLVDTISDNIILDEEIDKNINIQKLYININKLDSKLKTILNLKLNGLTMQDIAEKIGISQLQVNKDYNKALNILRDKLL